MMRQALAIAAAAVTFPHAVHASALPAFSVLDLNRDGGVTLVELRGWMEGIHRSLDRDNNGLLTLRELTAGGIDPDQAAVILSNNDMDQSGDLNVSELTILLPVLFDMADANRDRIIERAEYDAALAKVKAMVGGL